MRVGDVVGWVITAGTTLAMFAAARPVVRHIRAAHRSQRDGVSVDAMRWTAGHEQGVSRSVPGHIPGPTDEAGA